MDGGKGLMGRWRQRVNGGQKVNGRQRVYGRQRVNGRQRLNGRQRVNRGKGLMEKKLNGGKRLSVESERKEE